MKRRDFIKLAASSALLSQTPLAFSANETSSAGWRTFKLNYSVKLAQAGANASLWLPLPDSMDGYQRVSELTWTAGNATEAKLIRLNNVAAFYAHWQGDAPREISLSTVVSTRDRAVDVQRSSPSQREAEEAMANYLHATDTVPLDGIVLKTALEATQHVNTPLQKARAIYDWVVDNTFREPTVKGCGRGDIKTMLETGNLGGKCADINTLFVGLCRASGIPAREAYGMRVAESRQFKSLGRSGVVSKAQHCRAEFYLANIGWIPVDAADVRKAVLEEKLPLTDAKIVALRERLFGSWEMNWVAFNHERDVALNAEHKVNFFMYPCAEVAGELCDSLDPDKFSYKIESQEMA
jgi:transglutaminase-like putative cysteine protease